MTTQALDHGDAGGADRSGRHDSGAGQARRDRSRRRTWCSSVYVTDKFTISDGFDGTAQWTKGQSWRRQIFMPGGADGGALNGRQRLQSRSRCKGSIQSMRVDGIEHVNGRDAYVVTGVPAAGHDPSWGHPLSDRGSDESTRIGGRMLGASWSGNHRRGSQRPIRRPWDGPAPAVARSNTELSSACATRTTNRCEAT